MVHDVIVVGGGPAGIAAAAAAQRRGLAVYLLDAGLPPYNPLHSVVLVASTQALLAKLFPTTAEELHDQSRVLVGMHLHFGSDKNLALTFSPPARLVFKRDFIDHMLLEAQIDCHEGLRLEKVTRRKGKLSVTCRSQEGEVEIACRSLIIADGASASGIRTLAPRFYQKRMAPYNYLVFREIFFGQCSLPEKVWHSFFLPQPDHINLVHKIGGYIMVDIVVNDLKNALPAQARIINHLKHVFGLKIENSFGRLAMVGNNMIAQNRVFLGNRRILFTGNAAGFNEFLYLGIGAAIEAGNAAGIAMADRKDSIISPYSEYKKLTNPLVNRLKRNYKLKNIFFGYPGNLGEMDFKKAFFGVNFIQRMLFSWKIHQTYQLISKKSKIRDPHVGEILTDAQRELNSLES